MTISVVIPAYNCGAFVCAAIESALSQGANVVVVDDGSPDDAAARASAYPITILRGRKGGVSSARNAGAACTPANDHLLFLDGDDVLGPGMLATLHRYLDEHPNVGAVYCGSVAIEPDGAVSPDQADSRVTRWKPTPWWVEAIPEAEPLVPFESFYVHLSGMIPSATLIRRAVWDTLDGWDETLQQPMEDHDIARQLSLAADVHYVRDRLLQKRHHAQQSSRSWVGFKSNARLLREKWRTYGTGADVRNRVRLAQQFDTRYQLSYRLRELRWAATERNLKWLTLTVMHLVRNAPRYRRSMPLRLPSARR